MSDDKPRPLTIDEIEQDLRGKSKTNKPKDHQFGYPIAVGHTGISLGRMDKPRSYDRDDVDDETPNGETVGARITITTRIK